MFSKILIVVGILAIIAGVLAVPLGIRYSFASVEDAPIYGMSEVSRGVEMALWGSILAPIGGVALAIGLILFYKQKKN